MSIKGLTDRGLSFPEIGQIRKGAKKEGNRPGADLTYFRVEFDEREQEADATFRKVYGDHPVVIRIVLPFNEIERQWDAWLEAYTAGRMVARSDGENILYLVDAAGKVLVKNGIDIATGNPRPYVEDEPVSFYKAKDGHNEPVFLKPAGRLKVIIPELARAAYLTVLTTSIHDIANISDQLRAFHTANNGRISGIPLILRRRPKKISTPNPDGTRARRVKSLLSIEADPEWVRKLLGEFSRLALPGGEQALLPPLSTLDDSWPDGDYELDDDETEDGQFTTQASEIPAAVTEAMQMTTPRGTPLADLNDSQLEQLVELATNGLKAAATSLLEWRISTAVNTD